MGVTIGTISLSDNDVVINRPSSPMLFALREAVDSVSNMADFKMIEKLGSGFFGEVFKVQLVVHGHSLS